jgi:hypothetical protein
MAGAVVAEIERAVLADDGGDRPEAGDEIAPPGRTAGDGDDVEAGRAEALQRVIAGGAEPPSAG